jgi:hypothetical protein
VGGGEPENEPPDGGWPGSNQGWHIGLDVNGSVSSLQTNVDFGVPTDALPDILSPEGVHMEVSYRPNGQIDVFATANDGSVPRTHVISTTIPPLEGAMIIGFTAGTTDGTCTQEVDNLSVGQVECPGLQKVGDVNQDGAFNVSDSIALLNFLFAGGPPTALPCGDGKKTHQSNRNLTDLNDGGAGAIDISDAIYGLRFLFMSGPPPLQCIDPDCTNCIPIQSCPSDPEGGCPET